MRDETEAASQFIIRAAAADVPALAALARETYAAAFGAAMPPGELEAHLDRALTEPRVAAWLRADVVLVAEAAGRLAGYVQFGDTPPGEAPLGATEELRRIFVHADFQNQGLGTRLMQAALAHPRLRWAGVWLDVWERNLGAQRFYARHGFERAGERRFFFPSGAEGELDYILIRPAPPA